MTKQIFAFLFCFKRELNLYPHLRARTQTFTPPLHPSLKARGFIKPSVLTLPLTSIPKPSPIRPYLDPFLRPPIRPSLCPPIPHTHPPHHPSATNPQPFCLPGDDCRTYGFSYNVACCNEFFCSILAPCFWRMGEVSHRITDSPWPPASPSGSRLQRHGYRC